MAIDVLNEYWQKAGLPQLQDPVSQVVVSFFLSLIYYQILKQDKATLSKLLESTPIKYEDILWAYHSDYKMLRNEQCHKISVQVMQRTLAHFIASGVTNPEIWKKLYAFVYKTPFHMP